jgi:hypothetical protein
MRNGKTDGGRDWGWNFTDEWAKKDLPLIRVYPVEGETGGKTTPKLPQSLDGRDAAAVTGDLKLARTGDPYFNLVAFLHSRASTTVAFQRTNRPGVAKPAPQGTLQPLPGTDGRDSCLCRRQGADHRQLEGLALVGRVHQVGPQAKSTDRDQQVDGQLDNEKQPMRDGA